jgi:hypothetical protein
VRAGPVGRRTRKDDKKISIQELVIDIRTPDDFSSKILPQDVYANPSRRRFCEKNGQGYILNPSYILGDIISYIEILLQMSYHTASYGALLYERIGNIKVLMDGELQKEWDLARRLADVSFNDSFGNFPQQKRRGVFAKWKLKAYQARSKLGLPGVPLKEEKIEGEGSTSAMRN